MPLFMSMRCLLKEEFIYYVSIPMEYPAWFVRHLWRGCLDGCTVNVPVPVSRQTQLELELITVEIAVIDVSNLISPLKHFYDFIFKSHSIPSSQITLTVTGVIETPWPDWLILGEMIPWLMRAGIFTPSLNNLWWLLSQLIITTVINCWTISYTCIQEWLKRISVICQFPVSIFICPQAC